MPEDIYVARVTQVKPFLPGFYHHPGLEVGRFYPLGTGQKWSDKSMNSSKVAALVIRQNTFAVPDTNMILRIGDIFKTAPGVVAALEFLIGGKVGINQDSAIQIVTERSVADADQLFTRVAKRYIASPASLWVKAVNLKMPLEIQTNGGVMGIKG